MDFVSLWQSFMPRGQAWTRSVFSVFHALAEAVAVEFGRIQARADGLLDEMDPRSTTELIADWERITGLPDPCAVAAPTSLDGRRAAVTARLVARGGWSGGPSVPFLTAVMVALGYAEAEIVVRRFHRPAFTCQSGCNAALNFTGAGWPFVWEFIVRHGELDEVLMCQVSRYALAHLGLTFAFPLFSFADGTFARAGTAVFTDPVSGNQVAFNPNQFGTVYVGA
jgi:uncharacterized protein YmfQ (DUF2313 family)